MGAAAERAGQAFDPATFKHECNLGWFIHWRAGGTLQHCRGLDLKRTLETFLVKLSLRNSSQCRQLS